MIKLDNVTKKFGEILAISNFSLQIEKGEFVGVLGPSGCGKTTLLRLIAGLDTPDTGTIEIGGEIANNPKILIPPRKRKIGMVFQDLALWPHMTVEQHLKFVLENRILSQKFQIPNLKSQINSKSQIPNSKTNGETSTLLELVRLPNRYLHSYPHQLSGGEKQRLAIARSLAQNPQILLLDEPLANLDTMLKSNLQREIKKLQKNLGLTLIYVTHDTRELKNLAERLVIMVK